MPEPILSDKMSAGDEKAGGDQPFATAVEVDGLRRTLDQFMKKQDQHNTLLAQSIEKLTATVNQLVAERGSLTPEDKGSAVKGNEVHTPDPQFLPKPSQPILNINKSVTGNRGMGEQPKQYYTPPPKLRAQMHKNSANHGLHGSEHHNWSTHGQNIAYSVDDRDEEEDGSITFKQFDENKDSQHLEYFNAPEPVAQIQQSMQKPLVKLNSYTEPQQYRENHHSHYDSQMLSQHKAIARGPKLQFPEFNGDDPDGWIRKAEKYFEMVGVPTEN